MHQFIFKLGNDIEVSIENTFSKQSLLDIASDHDIDIRSLCGGAGVCKKCLVHVEEGCQYLEEIKNQQKIAQNGPRYACQTVLTSGANGKTVVRIN